MYPNLPYFADYGSLSGGLADPLAPVDDKLTGYFARYLLQKAISVFEWRLPRNWSRSYFLYVLYCLGRVAIVNTDRFGVICQACGLMGYNVYYQPTNAIITNALLTGIMQPRINDECVVLKLQPDFGGIMDLVTYYANQLAACAESISANLINSKSSLAFFARSKAQAESFLKAFDELANGKPAIVVDKTLLKEDGSKAWESFVSDVKQNYIVSDVLSDMRKIEADFDTEIGIPNANTDKRERLISDEVNANNVETFSKCALWLEELQDGITRAREMFDLSENDLAVDWRKIPEPVLEIMNGGENNATQTA